MKVSGAAFMSFALDIRPSIDVSEAKRLRDGFEKCCQLFSVAKQDWMLAQCAHESARFRRRKENLNYSPEGLLKTFPKYFKNLAEARSYARRPMAIANRVYGGRMGNDKKSEGGKFIARGGIGLTGKRNHVLFKEATGIDVVANPSLLEQDRYFFHPAGFFWVENGLDLLASFRDCTRRINGGLNGLKDRELLLKELRQHIRRYAADDGVADRS